MMKKFVFGISMMAALLAAPVAAVAGNSSQNEKPKSECPAKACRGENMKECKNLCENPGDKSECKAKFKAEGKKCGKQGKDFKKGKKQGKCCEGKEARMGKHGKDRKQQLFQGITLNESQQQKLTALDAKVKAQRADAKAKMKEERQKLDKKKDENRAKFRAEYDKAIKDILTPEQYAKFQENQKIAQEKRAAKADRKHSDKKSDKKFDKNFNKKGQKKGNKAKGGKPQENSIG